METFVFFNYEDYELHSTVTHVLMDGVAIYCDEIVKLQSCKLIMSFNYNLSNTLENENMRYIILPNCYCNGNTGVYEANISNCKNVKVLLESLEPQTILSKPSDQGTKWFINKFPNQCIILDIFTLMSSLSLFSTVSDNDTKLLILTEFTERNNIKDLYMLNFFKLAMNEIYTDLIMGLLLTVFETSSAERLRILKEFYDMHEKPENEELLSQVQLGELEYKRLQINYSENETLIDELTQLYTNELHYYPPTIGYPIYKFINFTSKIFESVNKTKNLIQNLHKMTENNKIVLNLLSKMLVRMLE